MNKSFPLLCPKGLLMGFVSGRCVVIGVILHMATASFLLSICSAKDPPALYIFGDSLVDAGNNFYVNTAAKANFPNGIDFGNPIGIPSGRFTNGEEVGLASLTPPYLAPTTTGDVILKGVNYASSASGILNDTERFFRLYNLDARKFIVTNSAAVGCIPFVRDLHSSVDGCVAVMNQKAELFNSRLNSLLAELTKNLEASTFICANVYAMLDDILNNYMTSYDFEVADSACCHIAGAGLHGGLIPCGILSQVCPDRSKVSIANSTVPANFILGDSLVDAGNNNYIVSLSKANYIPNGIDFGRPTGRYTNGRTIADIIGQELGFEDFTPPFLAPTTVGSVVLRGVNYASGGGGILNYTGKIFGGRINLDAQIDNFANTRQGIIASIGAPATLSLLKMSLFAVVIGSNDFINNYLTPVVSAVEQKVVAPDVFVDTMVARFRLQLTRLYNLGARKILVANVGPIGCIPYQRDTNPAAGDNCVSFSNQIAQLYNTELKSLVTELGANLEGSNFVYADVYRIVNDILQNYRSYGFENANASCCYAAGHFGGLIPCGPSSKVCFDRSKYVFWDPYHPSDAANVIIAKRLLDGDSNDISPLNIRRLATI
ncbi:hypothetical protein Peur_042730 [Populus x canadensis]